MRLALPTVVSSFILSAAAIILLATPAPIFAHHGFSVEFDGSKYQLEWGGQFENQQRAQKRLAYIVPAVIALIFILLYSSFGTIRHAALILTIVPVAMLGGLLALWSRGMTLNVSSAAVTLPALWAKPGLRYCAVLASS